MHPHIDELLSATAISNKVIELGQKITKDYEGKELVVMCVMKGGMIFCADLMRQIKIPHTLLIDGDGTWYKDNMHLLIVDGVCDTGKQLHTLIHTWWGRVKSIELCVLLNKVSCRRIPLDIKYIGFNVGSEFVVGYGMDYQQQYRGIGNVGVIK